MSKFLPYLKAIVAFVAPAVVLLLGATLAASDGGETITRAEWITALITCLGASGTVYAVPNKDPRARHQAESVQPPAA